jgi:hypothetical protein
MDSTVVETYLGTSRRSFWRRNFVFFKNIFKSRRPDELIVSRLKLPAHDLHFEYNMSHKNRGIAMIFNHEHFHVQSGFKSREGTNRDRDQLKKTLSKLKFDVKAYDNLTFKALFREVNKGEEYETLA